MRHKLIRRIQQTFLLVSLLLALSVGVLAAQTFGLLPQELSTLFQTPAFSLPTLRSASPTIGLISGHAGYDSGAVCEDAVGQTLLTEADVNAQISGLVARRLEAEGLQVLVLEEYDSRLNGLQADGLISLHADSCIDLSGYKAAHRLDSTIPEQDGLLLDCINQAYGAGTGLSEHPNTITHNMTSYHAFRRVSPNTPSVILEMGFLGGDQALLTTEQSRVSAAITDGITCFLAARDASAGSADAP